MESINLFITFRERDAYYVAGMIVDNPATKKDKEVVSVRTIVLGFSIITANVQYNADRELDILRSFCRMKWLVGCIMSK